MKPDYNALEQDDMGEIDFLKHMYYIVDNLTLPELRKAERRAGLQIEYTRNKKLNQKQENKVRNIYLVYSQALSTRLFKSDESKNREIEDRKKLYKHSINKN